MSERLTRRWLVRLALVIVASVTPSGPADAQTVLVRVVGADGSQPLVGAVAHLLSAAGDVVASRLSDQNGRALFVGVASGRYSVRAEMIGHGTLESESFAVQEGTSVPLMLRLETLAIALEGVEVTAESGRCEMRPRQEGRLLAAVWEEARKALGAAALTDSQGIYRYSLVTYEQDLDAEEVILDEQQRRRQGYQRTPFASAPVEDLTGRGFVERSVGGWTYYAPDAGVLFSDPFLDAHCYRLIDGGPERPDLVGLAFEPTRRGGGVPDISGTLWLDRDSVHLRWLDYTYENLEPEIRPGEATGRVDFQRMPAGTWIVPEWWIRMPLVRVDAVRPDRRSIVGFRRTGGRIVEIREAGGRDLGRGVSTGAIEGVLVDTLGLPIAGAQVGTAGSGQTIFTDAEGRFTLGRLPEGTYRVHFADARIDSLGLAPPTVTQEVVSGVSASLELFMPRPADLLREACGAEATDATSVLAGAVRDVSTGAPIRGAAVRVVWSRVEILSSAAGLGTESEEGLETTTDASGAYRFCSVPRARELTLTTRLDGRTGRPERLSLGRDEPVRVHFLPYRGP